MRRSGIGTKAFSLRLPGNRCIRDGRDLLAYCRTHRGDFDGMPRRQWLATFRAGDFTGVRYVNLSKNETTEALAEGEGRAYIVTVELGETVRVYAIPDRRRER